MTGRVVFLRYTDQHHESAARALRGKVLDRICPGLAWDVTVVDNALEPGFRGLSPEGWRLIGGDNTVKEFSGWEKALGLLAPEGAWQPQEPVLLVNDTFHRNYDTSYLEHLPREPVADWVEQGALVGHVDLYPREIRLFGLPLQHWLRSSFVLGSWQTLGRLLPLVPQVDPGAVFAGEPGRLFAPGGPLGERYKQYLEAFLLGRDSEYACRWHTSLAPGPGGAALLRVKVLTILCEHLLSARARRLGIALRDASGALAERERCLLGMAVGENCSDRAADQTATGQTQGEPS